MKAELTPGGDLSLTLSRDEANLIFVKGAAHLALNDSTIAFVLVATHPYALQERRPDLPSSIDIDIFDKEAVFEYAERTAYLTGMT